MFTGNIQLDLNSKEDEITTAAHKDSNDDWTPEELQKIDEYKQLLRAARQSKDK